MPRARLVRCRVRALAKCFYACRLPLEDDQPDNFCRKSPEMSSASGSIVIDFGAGVRGQEASRKMSTAKKVGGKSSSSFSYNVNRISGGLDAEPHIGDEDYIVFCFREDGEIDMINEGMPSAENEEHVALRKAAQNWGRESASKETDTKRARQDGEMKQPTEPGCVEQQPNSSRIESQDSIDSNLSDSTSTSSFAFPVLGFEWIGSPAYMPGSGNQSLHLHCCRF